MSASRLRGGDLAHAVFARGGQRFLGGHSVRRHVRVDVVAGEVVQDFVPPRLIGALAELPGELLVVGRLGVPEAVREEVRQVGVPLEGPDGLLALRGRQIEREQDDQEGGEGNGGREASACVGEIPMAAFLRCGFRT